MKLKFLFFAICMLICLLVSTMRGIEKYKTIASVGAGVFCVFHLAELYVHSRFLVHLIGMKNKGAVTVNVTSEFSDYDKKNNYKMCYRDISIGSTIGHEIAESASHAASVSMLIGFIYLINKKN